MLKNLLSQFINLLASVLGYIPAIIYGYIYSQFFTKATYRRIAERNDQREEPAKSVLDIGTATGHPLQSIIGSFKEAEIVGIDYDKNYIPACQKLFKDHQNVAIKHMNFYDMDQEFPNKEFDTIIFGSSFMIMPDQVKAIELAKKHLSKKGKIYFLLTLYEEKSNFNKFMEKIKPLLKYLTTVDFGKVTYRKQFEYFLEDHQLEANIHERCSGNFFLKYFKFYIYQVQMMR